MAKRKTNEEFIQKYIECGRNDITILGEYVTWDTKIKVQCKECNYIWSLYPNNIIKDFSHCPNCFKLRRHNEQAISEEEFKKKLKIRNPRMKLIGKYFNSKTKTMFKCIDCNYIWEAIPGNILNGNGCPICKKKKISRIKSIPYKEFMSKANLANKNITINKHNYKNLTTKIPCKCNICKYEWETLPYILINGIGCPKCSSRIHKTTKQFIEELEKVNPEIEVIGEYITNQVKIKCKCKQKGHIFESIPTNLLSGQGCPICHSSSGEQIIQHYLDKYNIIYIHQKTFDGLIGLGGGFLSYDFYLPKNNLLIEFQGKQHCKPIKFFGGENQFKKQQEHDRRKREYANEHNIDLLEIWYWDFDNIKNIIENYLYKLED